MLPDWFAPISADLGIIAGSLLALGVIWRYVCAPVLRYGRRLEATITAVLGQFQNNGGTTLRDAVDRIDQRTSTLEQWREHVDTRIPASPSPKPRAPRKKAT